MSIQGSAGIAAHTLSRPVSESPADTTVQRPRPSGAPVPTPGEAPAPQLAEVERVVNELNKSLEIKKYDLKYEIVGKHRIIIRVVNSSTGEILRQIPPADLLRGFRYKDAITGVRVDSQV